MSTYVIGDIHGCYNELQEMLKLIDFTNQDMLIMLGDYIDRGRQNKEMLDWVTSKHDNIIFLRGNHEEEFIEYIDLMTGIDKKSELSTDYNSMEDTRLLYESCFYYIKKTNPIMLLYFDAYNTVKELIYESHVCFRDIIKYKKHLQTLPYYYCINNIIMVHAGYIDDYEKIKNKYSSIENFYIYARDDGYQLGGVRDKIIISGHTPTIEKDEFCYNDGDIFHYYNESKNCHYYNIDGGIVFRNENPSAQLCCLCLDNMEEFYI